MKVQPSVANNIQSTQTSEADKAKSTARAEKLKAMKEAGKSPNAGAISDSAKPEISEKAKEFSKALSVASSAPDVREDKIAELKKRINEGRYEVDSKKVADKLVDDHLAF